VLIQNLAGMPQVISYFLFDAEGKGGSIDFATRRRIGPSLETILKPVAQDLENFQVYLVARRMQEIISGTTIAPSASGSAPMRALAWMMTAPKNMVVSGATLTMEFATRNPLPDVFQRAAFSAAPSKMPLPIIGPWFDLLDSIFGTARGAVSVLRNDKWFDAVRRGGGQIEGLATMNGPDLQKALDEVVKGKDGTGWRTVSGPASFLKSVDAFIRIVPIVLFEPMRRRRDARGNNHGGARSAHGTTAPAATGEATADAGSAGREGRRDAVLHWADRAGRESPHARRGKGAGEGARGHG